MASNWNLQNSIRLLNDFCADTEIFSFKALAALRLKELRLQIDAKSQELTIILSSIEDYQIFQQFLIPNQRLYQLLGLHFKQVHLFFGIPEDPLENSIHLETISLVSSTDSTDLRDPHSLGARLRRAINVALQGHVSALRLHDEEEMEHLKQMWDRGRIKQLLEKNDIIYCYDFNLHLVKLWNSHRLIDDREESIIFID
jgi:hypothetical protein